MKKLILLPLLLVLSLNSFAQQGGLGGGIYGFPSTGTGPVVRQTSPTLVTPSGDTISATTAFRLPAGSVTIPGAGFSAETNTGIYRPGASMLALTVAGTERVSINGGELRFHNAQVVGFSVSSTPSGSAVDTAFSRSAAGVLAIGANATAGNTGGVIDLTGIRIAGAATTANVLRGNGTNFVSAQLAAADLSNGTTGTGAAVLANSPTLVTPTLGAASATSVNFGGTALSNYTEATWVPTITNTIGTYTTTSTNYAAYTRVGRKVTFQVSVTVTTTGTAAGSMNISLPVTLAARDCMGTVRETVSSGVSGTINGVASSTEARLITPAGTAFGAGTGTYKATLTCDV